LVCQTKTGLVLVDQHAAHERVAFERLLRAYKSGSGFGIQNLLIPFLIDLEAEKAEAVASRAKELEKFGLEIELLGPTQIGVRSLPELVKESALGRVIEKLANDILSRGESFAIEHQVEGVFASLACHSVVRAGQALSVEQMRSLLLQMDEFPLSGYCPHGRPVKLEYSLFEIEKKFGRIV
jgi:DNA mismatch repair protein MutL